MADTTGNLKEEMIARLAQAALAMRQRSYAPYSGFAVGAALLAKNGSIYSGCNIENASFTPTICGERTAIFKAVSEGVKEFEAIAIAGGMAGKEPEDYCAPCGVCRQVMAEFCDPGFLVYLVKSRSEVKCMTLGELMPMAFDNLKEDKL